MSKKDAPDHPKPVSKIVLNFTDALTPVTWVFNQNDTHDILLKIEPAENGLHILQKINAHDVGDVEDLAFYSTRYKAIMALRRVSRQLQDFNNKQNTGRRSSRGRCGCDSSAPMSKIWGCFKSFCTWLVIVAILFYMFIGTQAAGYVLLEMLKARQDVMALQTVSQPVMNAQMPIPKMMAPEQSPQMPAYEPKIIPPHQAAQMIETPQVRPIEPSVSPTAKDVEAVGVPLSAEDYLEKRAGRLF